MRVTPGEGCQGPGDAEHGAVLDQEEHGSGGGHRRHWVAGQQVRVYIRSFEVTHHLYRRSAGGYHYADRPASVASVDRRQQRYRHRHHRQCKWLANNMWSWRIILFLSSDGDFPDESSTLSKLSKKSKPRSRSVDRDRSSKAGLAGGRSVSVSEDSGNSSLNTYATDTIQTRDTIQTSTSDWAHAPHNPQRLSQLISKLIVFSFHYFVLRNGPNRGYNNMGWY